jgi:integrase
MQRALSDRLLRALARPNRENQEIWDPSLRGFGCRARKSGAVSFFVMRRPRGQSKLVRLTLGSYPALGLAEARARAREALRELEDGVDPRQRKAEAARAEAAKQASLFAAVAEAFIGRHIATKRTARTVERLIRRELIPRWGEQPISDVRRADVVTMIDEIVARGTPEAARQAFTYARRLFGWAVPRYGLEHAPTDHLSLTDLIGAKKVRKRVLNNLEIALLWRATDGPEAAYYGPFARLLLLLGVRRSELGRAVWEEFGILDAALWAIPPNRMKSDAPHIVPLALPALEILRALPQSKSYVIGGANPIHYSCAKAELDARMTALNGGKPIPRWTWHDLRRTFRTGLSDLKIAPHIAELAIAHGKQGLNRIYDQHRYDTELHEAFALWAQRVMSIVAPPPETVVPLRKAT